MKGPGGKRGDFTLKADGQLPFGLVYGDTDATGVANRKLWGKPLSIFQNPTVIPPGQSVKAKLVFLLAPMDEALRSNLVMNIISKYFDIEILVTDHVSGVSIAVDEQVEISGILVTLRCPYGPCSFPT